MSEGFSRPEDAAISSSDASTSSRDAGSTPWDAGGAIDAGLTDSPGTWIAQLPVELIGITAAPEHVLYLRSDGTLMASRIEGGPPTDLKVEPEVLAGPRYQLWFWSDVGDSGEQGVLGAYLAATSTVTRLAENVLTDFFVPSDDGQEAIVARTTSVTASGNVLGAIVHVRADGTRHETLLPSAFLGRWNPSTKKHEGPCAPGGAFSGPSTLLLTLCVASSTSTPVRNLWAVDLDSGEVAVRATHVLAYVGVAKDRSFALLVDAQLRLLAVDARGEQLAVLEDGASVQSLAFLDNGRFAYATSAQALWTSRWPQLERERLLDTGVAQIEVASPDGAHLMFRQNTATSGLRDLWLVGTSSPATPVSLADQPDAYPGDDAFSADGRWVRWFAGADESFIGDLYTRRSDGSGAATLLASRAFFVLNYRDATRALVLANAERSEGGRQIVGDLLTLPLEGDGIPKRVVQGADAQFALSPDRSKVAVVRPEGPHAGLWVLEL